MHTPLDAPLSLLSTNNVLTDLIFDRTPAWEEKGWIGVPLGTSMRPLLNHLRQRCAVTTFGRIKSDENWKTLERARQDASTTPPRAFRLAPTPSGPTDPRFELTGAKLSTLTQALAYRGVLESRGHELRRRTGENLAAVMAHREEDEELTHSSIWMSIRHRDFSRPFAVLLWKMMHSGLKCGPYWINIQGYEDRAQCDRCGAVESIQHILFECLATGQSLIWLIVRTAWVKKKAQWTDLSLEDVLTLGLKEWKDEKGRIRPGATRLWRILVSEAVHLIWKLRCERVVGHADDDGWEHRTALVVNKLQFALNNRLALDVEATKKKYGNSALTRDLVHATWNGVLRDEAALPENWTKYTGFLVGRTPALRVNLEPD
ncbi:uncharacterized protein B0H18DRAFT_871247 [Fomitopsis serialis]|uniref:uncharacterized protein n=1 Tax=Fomitopsis serialis TaxID=139415 RepID=UPI0020078F44|nr:uncharacterized protein B0H18DRAFT_871247 [Neoantrodia serialis]KAH9932547.1 hypothetical protein B0H18DRAFT_871247 [Neoantrodia serialis]